MQGHPRRDGEVGLRLERAAVGQARRRRADRRRDRLEEHLVIRVRVGAGVRD